MNAEEIDALPVTEKLFLVNLYFARKKSSDPKYKNVGAYYSELARRYSVNANTLKNNQQRLDPEFDNDRKGWHKETIESQSKTLQNYFIKHRDISDKELDKAVGVIMKTNVFYSIKTSDPATVKVILKGQKKVLIPGLTSLMGELKVGQKVFIVFGGDLGNKEVTWSKGLRAVGIIVSAPSGIPKNYSIQVRISYLLPEAMDRSDFLQYRNAYDVIGIGPITTWEPNQALSRMSEDRAYTLVRALIDKFPEHEIEITGIFGDQFMAKVKEEEAYVLEPVLLKYGEKATPSQISPIEPTADLYQPDLEILSEHLYMDREPFEAARNFININKHLILTGPPGTGKTTIAEKLADQAKEQDYISGHCLVTATSEWSTFDTIGGYMPGNEGKLEFREGMVLKSIRVNKWLIIDEINRAEIDKAFGPLFTLLSGKDIALGYRHQDKDILIKVSSKLGSFFDESTATYHVGRNWRIIGTMNTYDKNSLYAFSYAFMRRFAFVNIPIPAKFFLDNMIDDFKTKTNASLPADITNFVKHIIKSSPRPIGPAIIYELLRYMEISGTKGHIQAIGGIIIPQLEGLEQRKVIGFYQQVVSHLDEPDAKKLATSLAEFFEISLDKLVADSIEKPF